MHTLHFDREDGSLWITLQLVAMVANFNTLTRLNGGCIPASRRVRSTTRSRTTPTVDVQKDAKGQLYLGLWGGNRTGMLDPKTGKVTEKQLPGPPDRQALRHRGQLERCHLVHQVFRQQDGVLRSDLG